MASTGVWFHTRYMRTGSPETPSSETLIDLQIGRTRNSSQEVANAFVPGNAVPQASVVQIDEVLELIEGIDPPVTAGVKRSDIDLPVHNGFTLRNIFTENRCPQEGIVADSGNVRCVIDRDIGGAHFVDQKAIGDF